MAEISRLLSRPQDVALVEHCSSRASGRPWAQICCSRCLVKTGKPVRKCPAADRFSQGQRHSHWSRGDSPGSTGHHIMDIRLLEAIEGGGGRNSVGTHVVKDQPIAQLQVRQLTLLHDTVQAVACRPPDAAGEQVLIRLWFLHRGGDSPVSLRTEQKHVYNNWGGQQHSNTEPLLTL